MAYTSCAANIAANIAQNCAHPNVGGYTGRAVLINLADNPTITLATGAKGIVISDISMPTGKKVSVIDNVWPSAFDGSSTQSNAESGRTKFAKTLTVRIPLRGSGTSNDIVEPLVNSPLGFLLVVEKKDRVGNGSFEALGYQEGMKPTADGIVRNENENGGDIVATLSCSEDKFEVVYFDTDYATTLAAFEDLMAEAF